MHYLPVSVKEGLSLNTYITLPLTVLHCSVQCCTVLLLHCTALYCTVQYSTTHALPCTALSSTLLPLHCLVEWQHLRWNGCCWPPVHCRLPTQGLMSNSLSSHLFLLKLHFDNFYNTSINVFQN